MSNLPTRLANIAVGQQFAYILNTIGTVEKHDPQNNLTTVVFTGGAVAILNSNTEIRPIQ